MRVWWLILCSCACGNKPIPPADTPIADGDADTDADADADADSDADVDTAGFTTGGTGGTGTGTGLVPAVGSLGSTGYYTLDGLTLWTTGGYASPPPYFPADEIRVAANIGYDATTDQVIPIRISGVPVDPHIEIILSLMDWSGDFADVASYCFMQLPLTQEIGPAPWVTDPMWWGVDYTEIDGPIGNCGTPGYEMDPAIWGPSVYDLFVVIAPDVWGVAIGEPTPEVFTLLSKYVPSDEVLGGRINGPGFLPTDVGYGLIEDIYAFGYQVDPVSRELLFDANGYALRLKFADVSP